MRDEVRLRHIIEAIDLIQEFTESISWEAFQTDHKTQSSVLYQFIVIGEAVGNIDPDLLAKYPYPWHLVKSFRNFLAHEYFGIKLERVWEVIDFELQDLKRIVAQILDTEFK
jgi:uncharacterized protein with HEPN domain